MAFTVKTREINSITILDCSGRLVFGNEALHLRERAKELLKSNKLMVLNLADVSYIDSGGLGVLVGLLTSARAAGGDLKLASPNQRAREVLTITHLHEVFEIHSSAEEAAKSAKIAAA
jgi:anti-sigma B factor antagonist